MDPPLGLALFLGLAVWLARGSDIRFTVFIGVFVLLIALSAAVALSSAHEVAILEDGLAIRRLYGPWLRLPWQDVKEIELVDRGDQGYPPKLVYIGGAARGSPVFLFDSIEHFDELTATLQRRARVPIMPMPLWKKILLLQWGV